MQWSLLLDPFCALCYAEGPEQPVQAKGTGMQVKSARVKGRQGRAELWPRMPLNAGHVKVGHAEAAQAGKG